MRHTPPVIFTLLLGFTLICALFAPPATLAQDAGDESQPDAQASDQGEEQPEDLAGDESADETEAESDDGMVEEGAVREGAEAKDDAAQHGIGTIIDDIAVLDIEGSKHYLTDHADSEGIVIAMTNEACPMCRRFSTTLKEIAAECEEDGLAFYYLDSTPSATAEELSDLCDKRGIEPAQYLHDPKGRLCALLGVESTTDAFLLDAATRELLYRGAVNDRFGIGVQLPKARNEYLRDAIEAHLAGEAIETQATSAPGCALDFSEVKPVSEALTWHGKIERVVQENCQSCHREGEAAPFPLQSYEDALDNKTMIKRVVRQRRMPPWFANPDHGEWKNEARLSDDDRQAIMDWVDAGAPQGEELDAPKPIEWPEGWNIGEPDLTITAGESVTVPAEGMIRYRYEKVTVDEIKEDKWVRSFEIRSTGMEAVHHVLVFIDYPRNHPRAKESPRELGGLTGFFAGMVPGQTWIEYPKGLGKFLPKGSELTFQIHYTAVGYEVESETKLGMIFTDGEPDKELKTRGVSNISFAIPPGAEAHEVKAHIQTQENYRLVTLMPHAHLRGVAFQYRIREPEKEMEILLDIPQYDFNWQLAYQYKRHRFLPKGSYFQVIGTYDNSANNPANPDPTATVRFGEQTWEEMMIGYVDYYEVDDEDDMLASERLALEADAAAEADQKKAEAGKQDSSDDEQEDSAQDQPKPNAAKPSDDEEQADKPIRRGLDRIKKRRSQD